MMLLRSCSFAFLFAANLFSQVSLTGKVTDSAGQGIGGVDVRLMTANKNAPTKYFTTSAADGSFTLTGPESIHRQSSGKRNSTHYQNGLLTFQLVDLKTRVQIDLLNIAGKTIKTLVSTDLAHGAYTLGISRKGLAPQMYVLMIKINRNVEYLPVSLVEISSDLLLTKTGDQALQGLTKVTAVIDTLMFYSLGYDIVKLPIESYTGTYNIALNQHVLCCNVDSNLFWGRRNFGMPKNSVIYRFLNRTNGAWPDDSVFWEYNGVVKSIAEQDTFDITGSGRIKFYLGKGKHYTDFIEFSASSYWEGHTSRIDGYGLPIALLYHNQNGVDYIQGEQYSVFYGGRKKFFDTYTAEVPEKFKHLAEIDGDKSIVCPSNGGFKATGKYADYYKTYVDSVWNRHAYTVAKPINAEEIFRCSGSMGGDPQMCAALNRGTAHLNQKSQSIASTVGTWLDEKQYYAVEPANFYTDFFHRHSFNGKAYAFAYDDIPNHPTLPMIPSAAHDVVVAIGF